MLSFAPGQVSLHYFARENMATQKRAPSARWSGAEAIRSWSELALDLIVRYQQNPLRAARVFTLRLHPADAPGRWCATPPLNAYNPAEPLAARKGLHPDLAVLLELTGTTV